MKNWLPCQPNVEILDNYETAGWKLMTCSIDVLDKVLIQVYEDSHYMESSDYHANQMKQFISLLVQIEIF